MKNTCDSCENFSILQMLAIFADNAEVGFYVADYYTCEVLLANRKIAVYAGKSSAYSLTGKPCWTLISRDGKERCPFCPYQKLLDDNGKPSEPYSWELYLEPLQMWLKVINQAVIWTDGRLAHMVTFYDITETKKMQEQLANLAFNDRLLGLKNDISMERDILEAPVKPSMILFDILTLQKINEAYGREMGDHLLRSVRDWILERDIPNSKLYRIGGDEFCLAVKSIEPDSLRELAKTLSLRFTEPWIFERDKKKLRVFCTASIAVILGEYIQDGESLLNLIDRTLKTAREKKAVVVYDKKMDADYKDRLQLELSLKRCVREDMDGFNVFYQPIIDSVSGSWRGLEALCRWNSPELGSIPPLLFIPEAERLELIGAIGIWALKTAVSRCKAWGMDRHKDFILDVNVSAVQFLDETLAGNIIEILHKYDYPGEKLCLEITESTQFTFSDHSLSTIEQLREHNILVALDDFATGYSNFHHLKNLPVDIVKIERAFVTNIERDEYHQYLFRAITELTHATGKMLIAEGVESMGQMDILIKSGADCLQGFLFSEPLSPDALESRLYRFYEQILSQ